MKSMSIMIKPASSSCNMRCKYCFYADEVALRSIPNYGIMKEETARQVLSNTFKDLDPGDYLTIAFQGGEPTIAGLEFFRNFSAMANEHAKEKKVTLSWALQTNGLLIDEDWCQYLREENYLVGLSLDGPADMHDDNRIDAEGKGTFKKALGTKKLFDKSGVEYNVLMTLTSSMARHPKQVWDFIVKENIRFVQFVPCLGPLDGTSIQALTPKRYGSFYSELYKYWDIEFRKGNYISVKLFDDIVNLVGRGQCNACGLLGNCQAQIIIEADGSTYPCDFFVLDEYKTGDLTKQGLREIWESEKGREFTAHRQERSAECDACQYASICHGGCKRMRENVTSLNGDECGHRIFLDSSMPSIIEIIRTLF